MGTELLGPRGGSATKPPPCDGHNPRVTSNLDALPACHDQNNQSDNRSSRQEGGGNGARRVRELLPGEPARRGEGEEREGKMPEEKEASLADEDFARFLDGIF